MASGGGPPRKVSASEGRAHRTWKRSNSTADGDDNASMTSNPLDARPNNWDFSDWQPNSAIEAGKRRKKAKANPEREREKERERERERSLSQDSSPQAAEKQHRTPSTFPRTKGTQAGQKLALENLRQHMTFSDLEDQLSNDGERNNARKVTIRRDRPSNYTRQDNSSSNMRRHGSAGDARTGDNRNNNRDDVGPDTNHIVSRLMQIRDYIKQASSMMDTLQKSPDPTEAQKASKLAPVVASLKEQEHAYLDILQRLWQSVSEVENVRKLLTHLREQEKSYMGLLQQLLALRDEASAAEHNPNDARNMTRVKVEPMDETASVDLDVHSEASDATTERTQSSSSRPRIEDKLGVDSDCEVRSLGSQTSRDQTAPPVRGVRLPSWDYEASRYESDQLRGREDGAGGAGDKKNELALLQEQEGLLRKLVDQQEQLRALQGRQESLLAMQKEAESKLKLAKARRNAAELASNVDGPQPPNIPADPLSDVENAAAAHGEMNPQLQNLRHRLDYLKKNIYDVKTDVTTSEPIEVNRNPDGSISDAGRKQLQDKLQELQNKKKRMDDLVSELQGLKSLRVEQLMSEDEVAACALVDNTTNGPSQAHAAEAMAAAAGGQPEGEAEDLMELMENQQKLKKLQEVRGRLNQLRQLVGYFEGGGSGEQPNTISPDQADQSSLPGFSDNDDMDITMPSNLRSPTMAVRAPTQETGTPATDPTDSQQQSDDDNMPASDTSETESRTSSLGPWGDDPEIQEKVRKLKAAKDKLRQLQNMVTSFQQNPGSLLPDDLAELATSLDEEMEAAIPGSSAIANGAGARGTDMPASQLQDNNSSSAMSEGELPQQAGERSEVEYEATMHTQLKELDQLKEERENLIAIRDQLRMLHQQYPPRGDDEDERARVPDRNNTEVKFAPEPQIQTITFSSNDELYDRMRKQRILREELRQKKRELEAIMRKDRPKKQYSRNQDNQSDTVSYSTEAFGTSVVSADATMATWGGSTVENLESITEDEDNSQEEQEDDAYPIDGIVQVEEEEEENEESGETYTIEDDVRQRKEARQQQQRRERSSRSSGRQTYPRPLGDRAGAARNSKRESGYGKKKWSNLNNRSRTKTRQGNYRSPEDIIEEDEQRGQLNVLQRQIETTNSLCQSLLQEQQSLYQMFRGGYTSPAGMNWNNASSLRSGMFQDPYSLPPPLQQQQQMMFKLNQCYQQMSLQQSELQSLQNQIQCLSFQLSGNSPNSDTHGLNNSKLSPVTPGLAYNPLKVPVFNSTSQSNSFSLNPQFPASFAFMNNPNAYAAANGVDIGSTVRGRSSGHARAGGDVGVLGLQQDAQLARDGFNNSRPSPPNRSAGAKGGKKSNTSQSATQTCELNAPASWSMVGGRETSSKANQEQKDAVPRLDLDRILAAKRERTRPLTSTERNPPVDESAVIGRVYSAPGRATAAANLASKKRAGDLYRPGLSAGISGTAHADSASVSSVVSSVTGNQRNRNRDTDNSNDLSLFNALRENIYAEVATLISQNENRPHFLIELFKDLQLLSSDYLRQTTLFSIRELVSRYLPDDNVESGTEPLPPWLTSTRATNSELTPSESLLTSDDEDLNERLDRRMAATRALTQQILQRTGSLNNENFDYVETAENTSSLSTPSTSYKESPFAQDSLGDTVIHFDQTLQRMREYEQQKTEAEHAEKVRKMTEKQSHQKKSTGVKDGRSEERAEAQSDSSTSDVPHPRIDTQQLDHQIKSIMTEVIPVIKEHMDDVCSPQLLAYIKRLVVSLTRQENKGQEVARFFNRQLGSILRDSLVKFEGRKLRECGEDLLVELSEVLFNELAFCRLLRDLDDPAVSAIQPRFHSNGMGSSSSASQRIVNYDPDSTDEEGSESTSLGDENEAVLGAESGPADTPSEVPVSEVEDLGKRRDDELAAEFRIQDADEKDDEPESQFKSVIELAVSETKPFTRIGSDEDDEESDESLSAEDPSETAVSRDAKLEQKAGLETLDADGQPSQAENGEGDITVLAVTTSPERGENLDAAGASPARVGGSSQVLVNGDAAGELNGEVTVDDLPAKLNVVSQSDLENQISEEQAANSEPAALVNLLETEGNELAGDGQALREPDSSSC